MYAAGECFFSCLYLLGFRCTLTSFPRFTYIQCTRDSPFEIVNTAERALRNLVDNTNPGVCFEHLLPFTSIEIDLNDKNSPPELLSVLRTMRYLVDRVSPDSLKAALPSMLPLFHTALDHKSVDMRKATVFVLVELHVVLGGNELNLDDFKDCQRRLINVYIGRHPNKSNTMVVDDTVPSAQPIVA